jgi:hypothetical protein
MAWHVDADEATQKSRRGQPPQRGRGRRGAHTSSGCLFSSETTPEVVCRAYARPAAWVVPNRVPPLQSMCGQSIYSQGCAAYALTPEQALMRAVVRA